MDTLLTLKPIELIDIGIDKLTKIPIPILNENVVSDWDYDSMNLPIDYIVIEYDGSYEFNSNINSKIPITITFDWGDGSSSNQNIGLGGIGNQTGHTYAQSGIYTINIIGPVSLINSLIIGSGMTSINLSECKSLEYLDLRNNKLTTIDLDGLINLKNISLQNNNIVDVDYDIYIIADTFPISNTSTYLINTFGNSPPTIYSEEARNSLIIKGWGLTY